MKEADIRPLALFDRYLELARQDISVFFSAREQFHTVPCPGCAYPHGAPAFIKHGFQYMTCESCNSLYVSPRPSPEMIERYYRESTAVKFWATHFYQQTESERRKRLFAPRAQLVHQLASRYGLMESVFLDVGSGYGVLLEEVAQQEGFSAVVGIEPSPHLAQVCRNRGFSIIEKYVEAVTPDDICAGLITSFEVLEHLYDPFTFLHSIYALLQTNGVLLLTTLTCSGFDIQELWEHSKSVYPPHHINLMSVEGIERLFIRAGFEITELSTPGELDVSIVENMLAQQPDLELSRFGRYMLLQRGSDTHMAFQEFLQSNRLSSHIRIVARRVRYPEAKSS